MEQLEKLFAKDVLPLGALPVYDNDTRESVILHKGRKEMVVEKSVGGRLQLTMTSKPRYVELIMAIELLSKNTDKTKIERKDKHIYWDGTIIGNDIEVLNILKLSGKNVIYDANVKGIVQLPSPQHLGVLCVNNDATQYGFFCYPTNVINIKTAQDLASVLA